MPKINSIPIILNLLNNRNIIALIYSVTICVAWILTSDWRKFTGVLPYMGVWSLAVKQVCFWLVKWATCTDFVAKKNSYSLLSATNFFATDNNLNCCQTGLNVASKVRNIAVQQTLQQCFKASRRFLPVSRFTVACKISSVPIRCKPLWYLRSDCCMHGNYYGIFRIVHGMLNWALRVDRLLLHKT